MAKQKIKEQDVINAIYGVGIFIMMIIMAVGMVIWAVHEPKSKEKVTDKSTFK